MAIRILTSDAQITVNDVDLGVSPADPAVSYTVRKLDPVTHRDIVRRNTKVDFSGPGRSKIEKPNNDAINDELIDYVLVAWTGVLLGDSDDPCPCTKDFKVRGLDWERKRALLEKAGANEIAREPERRAESFPSTA